MLAKTGQKLVRALALVFTTVVAPIAVDVVLHDLNGEESASSRVVSGIPRKEESATSSARIAAAFASFVQSGPSAPPPQSASTTVHPAALIEAVVQSTGPTPDEALQQALRIALYKAIVAEFGADAWARSGTAVFADVWHNKGGVIRSWKTRAVTKEWKEGAERYHADVTIEIDRQALRTRLHAAAAH